MRRANIIKALLVVALLAFAALAISQAREQKQLNLKNEIQLKSRETKLIELNNRYDTILKQKTDTEAEKQEQQKRIEELEAEKRQLEIDLQAKRLKKEQDARKLAEAAEKATLTRTAHAEQKPRENSVKSVTGDKYTWMNQAGIPKEQQAAADKLIQRESSWNPNAINKSSGACSLVQALPCSKIPGNWRDPVTALKWGNSYVKSRYGTWNAALQHSNVKNWY